MKIFLAEDNPADVYLLREALATGKAEEVDVVVAQDGEEALDFVEGRGRFADADVPDLIVLDLNLPKTDGSSVLQSIRESERLQSVPVVILTSSDSPRDRATAERLGANCYLTKPSDLDEFLELGGKLLSYVHGRNGRVHGAR